MGLHIQLIAKMFFELAEKARAEFFGADATFNMLFNT
jgi:hypothetical protein